MNNYYYSQRFSDYAKKKIANGYTMASHGCYITCFAMILSYFNDSAFYPDQMLAFLKRKHYVLPDARVYNQGLEDAAGFKLRFSYNPNPYPGDATFGIREVKLKSGALHWVMDHPLLVGKVIDPLDGKVKLYKDFNFTGKNRFFMGKQN